MQELHVLSRTHTHTHTHTHTSCPPQGSNLKALAPHSSPADPPDTGGLGFLLLLPCSQLEPVLHCLYNVEHKYVNTVYMQLIVLLMLRYPSPTLAACLSAPVWIEQDPHRAIRVAIVHYFGEHHLVVAKHWGVHGNSIEAWQTGIQ